MTAAVDEGALSHTTDSFLCFNFNRCERREHEVSPFQKDDEWRARGLMEDSDAQMSTGNQFGFFWNFLTGLKEEVTCAVRGPEVISSTPAISLLASWEDCSRAAPDSNSKRDTVRQELHKELNMVTQSRVHLKTLVLLFFVVHLSQPVCVDVPSATEAVLGTSMKLTCIVCMRREEIKAKTRVDWYYMPNPTSNKTHIYIYENDSRFELDGPLKGRLIWNGSQDLQDVSILILNVTYNDSGVYECQVHREFEFDFFTPSVSITKDIKLRVIERASPDPTALYSEIMMYVLLVFLTFWLLIEMVYCYRKISKSDEQTQDTATNYLAIPSEQKATPAAPVTE